MTKETGLKIIYSVGAVVVSGFLSLHLLPAAFVGYAQGLVAYLLAHSALPSAKTGKAQG
jgi:hypothetical protein